MPQMPSKLRRAKGIAIASRTAVGKPTFWSVDEVNWMWGIIVSETDDVVDTGICNWPSHMGSLNYGYANYSVAVRLAWSYITDQR